MIGKYGVEDTQVALIPDNTYYNCVMRLTSEARITIYASMFIVELNSARDHDLRVDRVLRALQAAQWRGVDVLLLIGGSRDNMQIAELSLTALTLAQKYDLNARWLTQLDVRGSHCKMVIADRWSLVGSHNWSPGAFSNQTQDSILVSDRGLAAYLRERFLEQWRRADYDPVAD